MNYKKAQEYWKGQLKKAKEDLVYAEFQLRYCERKSKGE